MDPTEQPDEGSEAPLSIEDRLMAASGWEEPEAAVPAPKPPAEEDADDAEGDEGEGDTPDASQATTPDVVEIEDDNGARHKVPAALQDAFMLRRDYTRKTQEVAELRQHAAKTLEAVQVGQQFRQSVQAEETELASVTAELERYKQVDWQQLDVSDYVKLRGAADQLKDRAKELQDTIQGKGRQFQQWQQQHQQQLVSTGLQYLAKAVPNWGKGAEAEASAQLAAVGYTPAELANVFDPRFVQLAWKAAQFDKAQAGKQSAMKKVEAAPPVLKPGPSQGQAAAASAKYKTGREQLKRSGRVEDAASLLAKFA